jgi:hypothetical protein
MRNLAYEQMTEYVPVAPGEYNVQVYPAGQTEEPLVNTVLTAPPERSYTIVLANCEMSPNKNKLRRRPCGRVIAKKPPRQKLLDSRIDKNQTAKILRMERQSSGLAILPEMRTPIS